MSLYDSPVTPYPVAPECLPLSPRPVQLTAQAWWLRIGFWAGLLLAPNVVLCIGYYSAEDLRELAHQGQLTKAQVTGTQVRYQRRRSSTYHVTYSFEVAGQKWSGTGDTTFREFQTMAEGGSCYVTYLPGKPSTNCLGEAGPRLSNNNTMTLIFAVLTALCFGFFVVRHEYRLSQELWLARHGLAVAGWITERDKRASWSNRTGGYQRILYWANYRFTVPDSGRRVDSWTYLAQDTWEYLFPQTPATILFEAENPSNNRLLCAFRYVCFLPAEETLDAAPQEEEAEAPFDS